MHIRRRYVLLGQTLHSQRAWDIRCGIRALPLLNEFKNTPVWVKAQGQMGVNAAYAFLFEPQVAKTQLKRSPESQMEGPDYLSVLKICDIADVLKTISM